MHGLMLPITLATIGIAALINVWLGIRTIRVRFSDRVALGDGGNSKLLARMRAQANFIEYTPIVLLLIGGIELVRGPSTLLGVAAVVFLIGRLLHPFGMEGRLWPRQVGMITTLTITALLAGYAILISHSPDPRTIEAPAPAVMTG
ncbi:MAPEG family protein [Sphingomonas qomolangmaensis]|uniref:MAPEG family protein n=1 Tax=Sphingomonas qomolangmaensis TaxID=2918765 RepID=A0ABY5L834_9SPHN|nr:MAPEG family protein [Sphingomonas qomolangmaensis]UUL81964.1 MAPEG family protein [Sphingomonas qomolangmaensis]